MGQPKISERKGAHKHGPRPAGSVSAKLGPNAPLGADEVAVLRLVHALRAELQGKQNSIEQQKYPEAYADGFQGAVTFMTRRLGGVSSEVINRIGQRLGQAAVGGFLDLEAGVFVLPQQSAEAAKIEAQDRAAAFAAIEQAVVDQTPPAPATTPEGA